MSSSSVIRRRPGRILLLGVGSWLAVVRLFWGRDDYIAQQLGEMLLAFGSLLVLILVPAWIFQLWWRKRLGRTELLSASAWLVVITAPFGGTYLSTALAARRNAVEVAELRAHCDELIPRLEAHRLATGSYPERLVVVDDHQCPLPPYCYFRDREGLRYRLGFSEEAEGLSGFPLHLYDSEQACWLAFDSSLDWSFLGPSEGLISSHR